jgi:hypothetical protein
MDVPVFVTVTLAVVVFPTPTVPKLNVVRLAESMPELMVFAGLFALVYAVQLDNPAIATIVASVRTRVTAPARRLGLRRASSECDWIRSDWDSACSFMARTV